MRIGAKGRIVFVVKWWARYGKRNESQKHLPSGSTVPRNYVRSGKWDAASKKGESAGAFFCGIRESRGRQLRTATCGKSRREKSKFR